MILRLKIIPISLKNQIMTANEDFETIFAVDRL